MLSALKFVQGSVARKDFIAALTHYAIEGGKVRGYNGTIAISSPIPFDIACKPKAEPLVRAIASCTDTVQLSMTSAGRLRVQSGSFKAFIDCIDGDTPHVLPSGKFIEINGVALLAGLKAAQPFISDDASKPWANGVFVNGHSVYATNNVCLLQYWIGTDIIPIPVNLPRAAVKELVRIDEPPTMAQYEEGSVTFHYEGDRWLRTQLLSSDWPTLDRILEVECNPTPIDTRIFDGLRFLESFVDPKLKRVFLENGVMRTHPDEGEGAVFEIPEFNGVGIYSFPMLQLIEGVAQKIDMTTYPKPCLFFGENLRGAIIGMRR